MKGILSVFAGAAVCLASSAAMAAGPDFCHDYTDAALRQVYEARDIGRCRHELHLTGQWNNPRWSTDRHVHWDWCRGASRDQADAERDARREFIDHCR